MFRQTGLAPHDVQAMFNASPNPYVVLDRNLVIVGANRAYLAVTGRSAEDIVGRGMFEAFPSDPESEHGQQLRQSFARVLATRQIDHIARIRYPIPGADGRIDVHVWSATHIPVSGPDDTVSHILQHTENITHLEQLRLLAQANDPTLTANILRRAEASQATIRSMHLELQLLRSIFEQTPGFAALLKGPQHVFELVNSAYVALVGQRELVGRTVREALPDIDGQGFYELLDQVYTSGQTHVGRGAVVHLRSRPDGPLEERHLDFVFQPIRQPDGQVAGIFVQGQDLSAQVAAQRRADTSQRRFETLAHTLPLHVWTAGADGRMQWCNDQVLAYLGLSNTEARNVDWLDVVHPEDQATTRTAWSRSMADGGHYLNEFRLRRHDGEYRWHLSRASALRDAEGRITQWVGSNTDIHDQKAGAALLADLNNVLARRVEERTAELVRTQEALRHSQQLEAIGSLTGGVAHEFNNLLQVIGGNVQLVQLARDGGDAHTGADRLARAMNAVQRGADLSRQLLAYGRRQPLQPEVLSVRELLHDLDKLLHNILGEGVQVRTVVPDGLWRTLVDPATLETALLNLALNARDAMAGRGSLTIEAANTALDAGYVDAQNDLTPGEYVLIAVSDTGHGMDAAVQARAFEPFFTTKPRGKGSGMGLSMVFGFAKQSGGHVKIYSEPGHGTTIRLYLPRSIEPAQAKPRPPAAVAAPAARTRVGHVLVVEDDDAVRETVVNLLRQLGHHVTAARDGATALALIEGDAPIDLLFTDVVMPGLISSTELAMQARRLRPGLQVLFTSGYTENALQHGGRLDPDVQLLSKPYTLDALQRKLDPLLTDPSALAHANGATPTSRRAIDVLLCEDDELVRESLVEVLGGMGCTVRGCGSLAEALAALQAQAPELLITDLRLPDGDGLTLASAARGRSAQMVIAVASGRGSRSAAAQVPGSLALDKPFSIDDLDELLALVPRP
jgi:PAS domain S-box-containing protein